MRVSRAPLLDNELVVEPGFTYFNAEGRLLAQLVLLFPILRHKEKNILHGEKVFSS